jgi:hypothetical protein
MRTGFALLAVLLLAGCGGGGDQPEATPGPQAPIVIESPTEGATVSSPLHVAGTASVFEANVILRLVAEDGTVLFENFVTATEGAPGRGTFAREIAFTASGPATLIAFEPSAADGSELHKVEVPLLLRP